MCIFELRGHLMALWPAVNFSRQTRPSVLSLKFYRKKVRLQCVMHIVHCERPDAQDRVEFCKKVAIWLNRKNEKFHLNFLLLQLEVATWEDTGTQDTGRTQLLQLGRTQLEKKLFSTIHPRSFFAAHPHHCQRRQHC